VKFECILENNLNFCSLVNNAGILRSGQTIDEGNSDKLRSVIDTNLMGLVFCTREAVKSIKERNVDGHIIHINSIAGHFQPYHGDGDSYGIYAASKFAVTAMAEQHRQEFMRKKLNIKVTVSDNGLVRRLSQKINLVQNWKKLGVT
jgi:NADP+-dependent farnesol dehydrogenase